MTNSIATGSNIANKNSIQVVQDVYHMLTGKTETLSRLFFDAHILEISDLEHLHSLLEDAMEQYQCKSSNCFVSIRYSNGKSERFSGFSKFSKLGVNRSVATISVELEYDFLIILPKTTEPKPYKLEVGLRSGLGVIEGFRLTQASETEKAMYFQLTSATARLEIHYVDLAVAKTLEATVEDWYRSLRKRKRSRIISALREMEDVIPFLLRMFLVISALVTASILTYPSVVDLRSLFAASVVTFGAVSVVSLIGLPLGSKVRKLIQRSGVSSYVGLSVADKTLLEQSSKETNFTALKAIGSLICAVAVGVLSAYLAAWLGIH